MRFPSSRLPPYRPGVRSESAGSCESLKALWTTQKDGYSAVTMATPWFTDHITELFFVEPTLDLKKVQPAQSPTFLLSLGARLCQIAHMPAVTQQDSLARFVGSPLPP